MVRKLLFLLLILSLGCASNSIGGDARLSDQERDDLLNRDLRPLVKDLLQGVLNKGKVVIPGFYAEGTKREPRMASYVVPHIEQILVNNNIELLERKQIKSVLLEQMLDSQRLQQGGKIAGADVIILGTVKELSLTSYRIDAKVLDVDNGRVIRRASCIISKKHLPIRYGGR